MSFQNTNDDDVAGFRGLGLMFDMVFNHTSTEHERFLRALAGEKKYQDYYIFRDDDRGDGRRFYTDGPYVHEYLKELVAGAGIGDMVTVGEMSSTSLDNCVRYTNPAEQELSMSFSFHHLKVDYKDGNKWPDLGKLKELLTTWRSEMQSAVGR